MYIVLCCALPVVCSCGYSKGFSQITMLVNLAMWLYYSILHVGVGYI